MSPVLALAGCTASAEEVRPPRDQLAFPTGMAVSPDEHSLFVVNANSELRYDSGSVGVLDLDQVEAVIASWATGAIPSGYGCTQDLDHTETLQCDEQRFFKVDSGVRVGNFATDLTVQDFSNGGAVNLRVFVPTRGDPSVAWADYDGDRLRCNASSESYPLCDDAHRLTSLDNDPDLAGLPNEPFSVFTHVIPTYDVAGNRVADRGFAMVSHLATGSITLIDSPADSAEVGIVDVISNVFAPDVITGTGLRGASTIAGRPMPAVAKPPAPAVPDELVYVASSSEDRVQTFTIGQRDGAAAFLLPGPFFFLNAVGNGAGNSNDTRSIKFSADGDRLYLVNRLPPSVQVFDTSITAAGVPRNVALGASDVCRQASTLAVANLAAPIGDRIYVTCFQDGQVYVVDPTGQSHVEDIISVGRGPFSAVVITGKNLPAGQQQLLVSNFLEDTIAVIDLSLNSPKRNRVVLRIGTPRAP